MSTVSQGSRARPPSCYDVIVVGGGPSGSTCALFAAREGLSVLLVDKETFPRDKLCGDVVPGACFAILEELGLVDAVMAQPLCRVNEQIFHTEDQTLQPPSSGDYGGLIQRRIFFDNVLFQAAKRRVHTEEGFLVTQVRVEDDRVVGVRGRGTAGVLRDLNARVVVGADGAGSVIARKLGLQLPRSGRGAVASRVYYRDLPVCPSRLEFHLLSDCLPGYFWIFPSDSQRANVGVGLFRKAGAKSVLKAIHRRLERSSHLAHRFAEAVPLGDVRGWYLPIADPARTIHGKGFLLTGDAAGLIDSFWGHGIDTAMLSGKLAAEVLAKACRSEDVGDEALAEYPRALWNLLGKSFAFGDTLHGAMEIPPLTFPLRSRLEILNASLFSGKGRIEGRARSRA